MTRYMVFKIDAKTGKSRIKGQVIANSPATASTMATKKFGSGVKVVKIKTK